MQAIYKIIEFLDRVVSKPQVLSSFRSPKNITKRKGVKFDVGV